MKKQFNKSIGNAGEELACIMLLAQGYEIIERNYQNKVGEIDIIAMKNGILTFVEVKTRTTETFGRGKEAVDFNKIRHIRKAAQWFLKDCRYFGKNGEGILEFKEIEFQVFSISAEQIKGIAIQ